MAGPASLRVNLVLIIYISLACCQVVRFGFCNESKLEEEPKKVETIDSDANEKKSQQHEPEHIKRELRDIVKRNVDKDGDGLVSYEELKNYLGEIHEKNLDYNVNKQWALYEPQIHEVFSWEGYEPDRKEVLTWDHYYNQTYPELIGVDVGVPIHREQDPASILESPEEQAKNKKRMAQEEGKENEEKDEDPHLKSLKQMVRRADARWKLADENGDTLLTKEEFKYLLHPDEGHEGLKELFIEEATQDMDLNKDKKICLQEFMKHLMILASDQERNDQNWLSSQQENFGRFLDKNKDGVLEEEEIKDWLVPTKSAKSASEAKRLLDIADLNEDHKISNAELMEHYEQFLNLLPASYWESTSDLEADSILKNHKSYHEEL